MQGMVSFFVSIPEGSSWGASASRASHDVRGVERCKKVGDRNKRV